MENLKNAKDEARQARKELKLSRHENDVLHEKLKSGQIERDNANNESEGIRREFEEVRKLYESALIDRVSDTSEAEAAHQAETARLTAEIDRLMAEMTGNNSAYAGEIEVLRTAFAEANASLSVEKAKNESALLEMDALERNAAVELKFLKNKVDTLTAEKQLLEKRATEITVKAHGEIERQQQLNRSLRTAAIKKLHALQEEIRQLAEARAVIASPTGVPLVQSGSSAAPLPADERKEMPVASQPAGFASDPFQSCESAEYINFLPDTLLKGIPYSSATDVVEFYRSYNTIHAAPTGKQAQRCDGFVCLVAEGERYQVYVAWLMNTSGEVLICLPERAVEGDDSCLRLLREGIGYFERMGFVIDRLPLEAKPGKRQAQLDALAVFCRTVTDCAA